MQKTTTKTSSRKATNRKQVKSTEQSTSPAPQPLASIGDLVFDAGVPSVGFISRVRGDRATYIDEVYGRNSATIGDERVIVVPAARVDLMRRVAKGEDIDADSLAADLRGEPLPAKSGRIYIDAASEDHYKDFLQRAGLSHLSEAPTPSELDKVTRGEAKLVAGMVGDYMKHHGFFPPLVGLEAFLPPHVVSRFLKGELTDDWRQVTIDLRRWLEKRRKLDTTEIIADPFIRLRLNWMRIRTALTICWFSMRPLESVRSVWRFQT